MGTVRFVTLITALIGDANGLADPVPDPCGLAARPGQTERSESGARSITQAYHDAPKQHGGNSPPEWSGSRGPTPGGEEHQSSRPGGATAHGLRLTRTGSATWIRSVNPPGCYSTDVF
jgi:hypothetical protein